MAKKTAPPPPAYFLSLSLENVRSFGEKQTISFARPDGRPAQWTIILGDNGVGKTTVLKSLASLMPVSGDDNTLEPAYNLQWQKLWIPVRSGRQSIITRKIKLVTIPETIRSLPDFKIALMSCGISINTKLSDKTTNESGAVEEYELSLPFLNTHSLGRQWKNTISRAGGAICYGYGAGRTTGNSNLSEISENISTCASLFNDRADLLNPEEWFLQLDYSSRIAINNSALVKQRELIEDVLLTVLPGVEAIRITSNGTPQKVQLALEFLSSYGWVRLRDMSLGYQTLVVWLTDFASKLFIRYPDSPNPLEEPAIVLIDEIDLHLHPSWQRKLIGFLSGIFKNTQFIATAHSPLVVQAAGDEGANVVLLRREGDQTVVVKDLPDVRRWRIEQILNSELFDDMSALSRQTEKELQRRNALLLKKRRTAAERAELEQLNATVAAQPIGDTQPERKVESLLARLARNLKEEDLLP